MQTQIKIKTIKTVSDIQLQSFDNEVNELIKAGWQILGPPIVTAMDDHLVYTQQFAMFEQIAQPMV